MRLAAPASAMLGGRVPELPAQLELDKHVIGSRGAGVGDVGHRDAAGKRSRRASRGWWWGVGGGWAGVVRVLTSSRAEQQPQCCLGARGAGDRSQAAVVGPEPMLTACAPPPPQSIPRAPSSDEECFFDLLSKFQSSRMDDQRCPLEEGQPGASEATAAPTPEERVGECPPWSSPYPCQAHSLPSSTVPPGSPCSRGVGYPAAKVPLVTTSSRLPQSCVPGSLSSSLLPGAYRVGGPWARSRHGQEQAWEARLSSRHLEAPVGRCGACGRDSPGHLGSLLGAPCPPKCGGWDGALA